MRDIEEIKKAYKNIHNIWFLQGDTMIYHSIFNDNIDNIPTDILMNGTFGFEATVMIGEEPTKVHVTMNAAESFNTKLPWTESAYIPSLSREKIYTLEELENIWMQ